MKRTVLAFALSVAASVTMAQTRVVGAGDGSTLTLVINRKPVRIRLAYIDPPNKKQPFGDASRQSLHALCVGKKIEYEEQQLDARGHTLAVVHCNGVNVNLAQVERGMAWVDKYHEDDAALSNAQAKAKAERKGLWADANPVPPWEFRRPVRKVRNPAVENTGEHICFVDRRGEEYRVVNGERQKGCGAARVKS